MKYKPYTVWMDRNVGKRKWVMRTEERYCRSEIPIKDEIHQN